MNGISTERILQERNRITQKIQELFKDEEIEIVESFTQFPFQNAKNMGLWCLGKSISAMSQADAVFFGRGWKSTRGCWIEYLCATAYGLKIITEE